MRSNLTSKSSGSQVSRSAALARCSGSCAVESCARTSLSHPSGAAAANPGSSARAPVAGERPRGPGWRARAKRPAPARPPLAHAGRRRERRVVVVSAEELVGPFAGKDDRRDLSRFTTEPQERQLRRIADRLVERGGHFGEEREEAPLVELGLVVAA